jgi:type I restriction enzyme S subunit
MKKYKAYTSYKNSGIPWLGEVPEHWEVRKLKYVAEFQSGEMITSESITETGDYPVFGDGGFRGYTNAFTNDGSYVLIGRQGALCGNIKYADGKFWASEHVIVTYPKINIATIYLGEILRVANLGSLSQTAAQPGISIGQIKHVKIPMPPPSEQHQIVSFIESESATITTTISTIEKEIALVEEYKTALIAEAVTGKIDVREYEVPELESEEQMEAELEDEGSMEAEDAAEYQTEDTE